jgi:hypothetical protein
LQDKSTFFLTAFNITSLFVRSSYFDNREQKQKSLIHFSILFQTWNSTLFDIRWTKRKVSKLSMGLRSAPVGHETRCDKIYITITIIIKMSIALKKVNCHYDAEKKLTPHFLSVMNYSKRSLQKRISFHNLFFYFVRNIALARQCCH